MRIVMGGDRNGNRFPLTPGGEKKNPQEKKQLYTVHINLY